MCCRMSIQPLVPELARTILRIGKFVPYQGDPNSNTWTRVVLEEAAQVQANLNVYQNALELSIHPNVEADLDHHGKRRTAGVYFEIAAKYAEKVDGEITQHANIGSCIADGKRQRPLASYPSRPLDFEMICAGFQREFITLPEVDDALGRQHEVFDHDGPDRLGEGLHGVEPV